MMITHRIALGLVATSLLSLACTAADVPAGSGGAGTGGGDAVGGTGSGGAPPAPAVTILSISEDSTSEHEPQLVIGHGGRMVAAWNAFNADPTNFYHVEYRVSDDLGVTWGPVISIPLRDDDNIGSNATLAVAGDGTIYLAFGAEYVDASGTRSAQRVLFARLDPADATFTDPIVVTDETAVVGVYDQPAITVMPSGDLLITYGQAPASLDSITLVTRRSTDGGATWTESVPIPSGGPTFMNLFHPCASGDRVYLLYAESDLGVGLWRSDDGGATFAPDARVAVPAEDELATASRMVDGNCVADGDEVWAIYGLAGNPNGSGATVPRLDDIAIAHSSDGGVTFDWHARVADPATGPHYLLPRLASPSPGVLDITYYEGEREADTAATYRHARSTDGGKTFAPSDVVFEPVQYELKRTTEQWLGDYMDLEASGGVLYGVFSDNRTSTNHVAFFTYAPD